MVEHLRPGGAGMTPLSGPLWISLPDRREVMAMVMGTVSTVSAAAAATTTTWSSEAVAVLVVVMVVVAIDPPPIHDCSTLI